MLANSGSICVEIGSEVGPNLCDPRPNLVDVGRSTTGRGRGVMPRGHPETFQRCPSACRVFYTAPRKCAHGPRDFQGVIIRLFTYFQTPSKALEGLPARAETLQGLLGETKECCPLRRFVSCCPPPSPEFPIRVWLLCAGLGECPRDRYFM